MLTGDAMSEAVRKYSKLRPPLSILASLLLVLLSVNSLDASSIIYFANQSSIDRLVDNVAVPVIQVGTKPLSLDCNSCDNRIYWSTANTIMRSFANSSTIETVLSVSLGRPHGVAIDWRSNLIYYTGVRTGESYGYVGVASCSGSYQRIFNNLRPDIPGPIAVDPVHGFMYFGDLYCCIWRVNLDGSNPIKIINNLFDIRDISVDAINSTLYWNVAGDVYKSNLSGGDRERVLPDLSDTTSLSANNGTLYLSKRRTDQNGSLFTYSYGLLSTVIEGSSLDPGDISTFLPKSFLMSISGGCSSNNGGCSKFCFTLPDPASPNDISTEFTCSCPTGFKLNANNQSCNTVPQIFLLIGQSSFINILSFDVEGEELPLPLPFHGNGETIQFVTYDRKFEFLYWSQRNPPTIMRSKIDGSERSVIVKESIAYPVGVAISEDGSVLYWADVGLDKIEVVSINQLGPAHRKVIVDTGVDHPQGIALNEELGYLYWTDTGHNPSIWRSNLDGSNQQILINNDQHSIFFPGPIAIHQSTGDIYWAEGHIDHRSIRKADKNGANVVSKTLTDETVAGLFFLGDVLYWTDRQNGRLKSVSVEGFLGSSLDTVISSTLPGVTGVTGINDTLPLGDHGCSLSNGGCSEICVLTGVNGTRKCLCNDYYKLETGSETVCEDNTTSNVIIATNKRVTLSVYRPAVAASVIMPLPVHSLDIDSSHNMMYWISSQDGNIYRGVIPSVTPNMSTYVSQLIITCSRGVISDLAIDWWGRNLYWTNEVLGVVGVAKLNGNNQQILVSGLEKPQRIIVNPYQSALYFSSDVGLQSVPLTGGPVSTIWTKTPQNMSYVPTNVPIHDITLDVSEQFLFWSWNSCMYEYKILTSHLIERIWCTLHHDEDPNGFHEPTLLNYVDEVKRLYFLLPSNDEVYYYNEHTQDDQNRVHLADWTALLEGVDPIHGFNVTAMKFNHYTAQPGIHWCSRYNAECGNDEDTLCLVKDYYDYECRCSPTKYKTLVYDYDREICRSQCNSVNSFALISSPSDIFFLPIRDPAPTSAPLPDPDCVTPTLRPQKLFLHVNDSSLRTMSYDPSTGRVLWIDTNNRIHDSYLNGSGQGVLEGGAGQGAESQSFPHSSYSMALDWYGGHLFWVDPLANQIYFVRTSGHHRGTVGSLLRPLSDRQTRPMAITMDVGRRRLYFSDAYSWSIQYISLDTPSLDPVTIETNPNMKLNVVEMTYSEVTGYVYWFDELREVIERYDPSSNNVTELISNVSNITALTAVTFNSVSSIYWYNQSDWSVYWYNESKSMHVVYAALEEGSIINSLDSYDAHSFYNVQSPCAASPCSHLCVVSDNFNQSSYTCACPSYQSLGSDNATCTDLTCPAGTVSCDDGSSCIFYSKICDGSSDCLDRSDEKDCQCSVDRFKCGIDSSQCIKREKLCDTIPDCVNGSDELNCTNCRSGIVCTLRNEVKQCISSNWICDGQLDCINGQDEHNCTQASSSTPQPSPTSSAPPTSTTPSPTLSSSDSARLGIIIATCLIFLVLVLTFACSVCLLIQCVLSKKRNITYTSRYDFPTSSIKSGSSPQPHLQSINTSDMSINTMETRSTHVEKTSEDARIIKRLSTISTDPSNPPNSPITTHRSVAFMGVDEMSMMSRPFSEIEAPYPAVPNPSMNFDAMSDNISSVSQHRLPYVNHHGNGALPLAPPPSHFVVNRDHTHHSSHPPPPYQSYYQPHVLDLQVIDEDVLTLDENDCASQFHSVPHPSPRPSPHRVIPHLSPSSNQIPNIPLVMFQHDNISEHTCTTISMTTFIEPLPPEYMSSSANSPTLEGGDMEEEEEREGERGEMPNVQSYYDCPPPPSPVTELSINLG